MESTEHAPTEGALASTSWICQRSTISVDTREQSRLCPSFHLARPLETAVHRAAEFFPKNNEEQWFGVGGASDWLGKKMRHKFRPYGPIVVTTKEALSGSLDTHTKQGQKKQEIKKRNYDISRAFHT